MRIAVLRCERLPSFVTWEIPDVEVAVRRRPPAPRRFRRAGRRRPARAWTDPDVDWDAYDAAVLRSTWDYVDHLPRFLEVTATIERSVHPPQPGRSRAVERRQALPRRPRPAGRADRATRARNAVDAPRIHASIARAGWNELVLKPAVGVGGAGVVRATASTLQHVLEGLPPDTEVMVQPFADAILDEGELSFIFIGGALSHVLRKRPATGDFRAHGIYGGTVEASAPTADDAEMQAMPRACPSTSSTPVSTSCASTGGSPCSSWSSSSRCSTSTSHRAAPDASPTRRSRKSPTPERRAEPATVVIYVISTSIF